MSLVGHQRRCGACQNFGHARHNIRCPSQPWNIGEDVSPNTYKSVIKSRRYRWQVDNGIRPRLTQRQRRRQSRTIIDNWQENTNTNIINTINTTTNTTNTIMQVINTLQNRMNTITNLMTGDATEPTYRRPTTRLIYEGEEELPTALPISISDSETEPYEFWTEVAPGRLAPPSRSAPNRQFEDPIIVTRQNDKTEAVTRIMTMVEENMEGMSDQAYKNIMDHLGHEYNT